jgi:hypothetical protein
LNTENTEQQQIEPFCQRCVSSPCEALDLAPLTNLSSD